VGVVVVDSVCCSRFSRPEKENVHSTTKVKTIARKPFILLYVCLVAGDAKALDISFHQSVLLMESSAIVVVEKKEKLFFSFYFFLFFFSNSSTLSLIISFSGNIYE
jgi:hypothetical protein